MALDILYVIGSLNRGGAEKHLLHILPRLNKKRFKPKIFLLANEGELAQKFRDAGIELIIPWVKGGKKTIFLRVLRLITIFIQVSLYILLKRPKVIHFFLPASYLLAGPISILCGVPFRIMSRRSLNYYQQEFPAFVKKMECCLHKRMHFILGNSQRVLDQLINEEGVEPQHTKLIYNGVRLKKPSGHNIRTELNISEDRIVFVIVANLIPYKGHMDLLEAFSQITPNANWDLLIVGNDSSGIQSSLKKQATALSIASHVHFLGGRDDVSDILHSSDIGILPSHEEGFSNAILECMAAGLPMIVTDVGGNSEAVQHGKTGIVVPPHNPDELAKALEELLADEQIRNRYGKAGKRYQEVNFSLEACVQSYEELYSSLTLDKA